MELLPGFIKFVAWGANMSNELWVFLSAMAPVAELRGAIPFGLANGLTPVKVFFISFAGNMLPVPFLILFSRPIIKAFKKVKFFDKTLSRIEQGATKKANKIKRYVAAGLFMFVAIPLPGTGAWTGSLISALLNLRLKYAIPIIGLGVLTAGIVVTAISLGAIHFFGL